MNQSKHPPGFHNRPPWNLIVGVTGLVLLGASIAATTTPWILFVPLVLWVVLSLRRHMRRQLALRDKGYFSHEQPHRMIYEERQGPVLAALLLPLETPNRGIGSCTFLTMRNGAPPCPIGRRTGARRSRCA